MLSKVWMYGKALKFKERTSKNKMLWRCYMCTWVLFLSQNEKKMSRVDEPQSPNNSHKPFSATITFTSYCNGCFGCFLELLWCAWQCSLHCYLIQVSKLRRKLLLLVSLYRGEKGEVKHPAQVHVSCVQQGEHPTSCFTPLPCFFSQQNRLYIKH